MIRRSTGIIGLFGHRSFDTRNNVPSRIRTKFAERKVSDNPRERSDYISRYRETGKTAVCITENGLIFVVEEWNFTRDNCISTRCLISDRKFLDRRQTDNVARARVGTVHHVHHAAVELIQFAV